MPFSSSPDPILVCERGPHEPRHLETGIRLPDKRYLLLKPASLPPSGCPNSAPLLLSSAPPPSPFSGTSSPLPSPTLRLLRQTHLPANSELFTSPSYSK
ncbi:unnamed protein product [Protopolystoma xenopodis]|uniref:Uncharacterized protein n=1 Tax=Protopolystoma xenopodis TaxID=117903 RepID=A0A3S5AYM2_9PLAT|nr:unnamed protein product [Protopolystoma xenopodis]